MTSEQLFTWIKIRICLLMAFLRIILKFQSFRNYFHSLLSGLKYKLSQKIT